MRDDIKRDLFGEMFARQIIIHKHGAGLRKQFVHGGIARTRNRLIGRHHHAAEFGNIMQGI